MRCIDSVPEEKLRGTYVLVRAGFDVPLNSRGEVADLFRVRRSAQTLRYLSERGARVVVMSHIGRDPSETNEPVVRALRHELPVYFVPDITGHAARLARDAMKDGDILMLENIRRDAREIANDPVFAKELATLGSLYVNDAFSAAHRAHASVVGVPQHLPSCVGLLVAEELRELTEARHPTSPSFAILGGAKFETKAHLIRNLLETYDKLFITGALANDVFKARGLPVGRSLVSQELPGADVLDHPRFVAPIDVTVESLDQQVCVKKPHEVLPDDKIVDIGPDSVALIAQDIHDAAAILWNGPTGLYEAGYTHWTHALAEHIALSHGKKVIGGGDTIAALEETVVPREKLGFFSTGGGAMLEFILHGTLPALEAVQASELERKVV